MLRKGATIGRKLSTLFCFTAILLLCCHEAPQICRIVYSAKNSQGVYRLYLATILSTGKTEITEIPGVFQKDCITPVFSPDGNAILFAEHDGTKFRIVAHELSTKESRQLTNGKGDDYGPAWSPDGTKIAWCSAPSKSLEGAEYSEIFCSSWPYFKPVRITKNNRMDAYPVFSADSRSVVFESGKVKENFGLFRAYFNGKEEALYYKPQRSGNGIPHINGKTVVFEGTQDGVKDHFDIYSLELDGRRCRKPLTWWATPCNPTPRFSPDGSLIACHRVSSGGSNIILITLQKEGTKNQETVLGARDDYLRLARWDHAGRYLAAEDVKNKTLVLFHRDGKKLSIRLPGEYRAQRFMEIYNFDIY